MGHALHHLLSKIEEPFVSGISGVAWDTVEFPSQFLEYFSYDKEVLKLFAKHYITKVLDDEAIDKIIKAKISNHHLQLLDKLNLHCLILNYIKSYTKLKMKSKIY